MWLRGFFYFREGQSRSVGGHNLEQGDTHVLVFIRPHIFGVTGDVYIFDSNFSRDIKREYRFLCSCQDAFG